MSTYCVRCHARLSRPDAAACGQCGWLQHETRLEPDIAPQTVLAKATLEIQEIGGSRIVPLIGHAVTLGRAPDNAIVLVSTFVSRQHARVDVSGTSHRIVDIGSRNGLLFEGRRVQERMLSDGDLVRIGDPATGNFITLVYHNDQRASAAQNGQMPHRYRLATADPKITIGRVSSDIVLDHPQVSRLHAQLDRLADSSHQLRDMRSTNGTFVNGQRITEHVLRPGDIVQIGPFRLVYNTITLDRYDQRGGLRIDARGLTRRVPHSGTTRVILHDVSLSIAPREFVALVGGSGAGKSTLMKALSGYDRATNGTVQVNGDDFYRHFDAYRTVLGYVPQDDIVHGALPVNRALDYTARLRLPPDTAIAERQQRIAQVLEDVDMTLHRDKVVENLSGGQRKRVSIGAELLANPSLFFLDEPTSGLDPGLEKKMMYTLRRLADGGRTVILVTHATANITQCDHVVFMSEGRMVYFGPPDEALAFFAVSSGDFADIYTKLEGPANAQSPVVQADLEAEYRMWKTAKPGGMEPSLAQLWEAKYRRSRHYRLYVHDRLGQASQGPVVTQGEANTPVGRPRVSVLRQFGILGRRYLDLTLQDRRNLLILLLQAPIIGLLLLLVARGDALAGADARGVIERGEAKKVLFMLATVSVWFGIINAAREITKEASIFRRERLVNLRIGPYITSKVTILSLLVLLQGVILLLLLAVKVHYPADTGLFLPSVLEIGFTVLLTSLAGMALGLVISASTTSPDRAISIVPLVLIPQILFAGLIFRVEGPATPLSWLTISRWAMDALGASTNLNALCTLPNLANQSCPPGGLETEVNFTHSPGHLLSRWAILLGYTLVCLLLTAWLLKRRDRQV